MRRRVRSAVLLAVLVAPALAGCFGGRARGSTTTRPTAPAVVPVTSADSAKAAGAAADSIRQRDSLLVAARADSVRGDSTRSDSTRKAAADSVAAAATTAKPARKAAPAAKQCVLDFSDSPPETRITYSRIDSTNATTYIGGGLVGHCQGEKNRISADSAEQFQLAGVLNLFGNVVFEEPGKMRIQAAHATYFTREERLIADGQVVALQMTSGSTFIGPSIEYFRPTAGRPESRLIAPGNPSATVVERDSTGKQGEPVRINAATMIDVGDSLLFAIGSVVITRGGLVGRSDSATFDKGSELARLIRNANVINQDTTQRFTLTADTINLFSRERQLERVLALHKATAVNSDVTIQAEKIDLRLKAQKLTQAFAYGTGRAKARTPQQEVVADSLDIVMPEQRVSEMRAVGTAVATGVPDTLKIKSDDRDLLRGDTVIASFDSAKVAGDTAQPRIRQIRALGNASSLFQIASKQGPTFPPSLNYARGKTILVQFDSGSVRDVTIDSTASGMFLEPAIDSLSDSTRSRPGRRPPEPSDEGDFTETVAVRMRPTPRPDPLVPIRHIPLSPSLTGSTLIDPRRRL